MHSSGCGPARVTPVLAPTVRAIERKTLLIRGGYALPVRLLIIVESSRHVPRRQWQRLRDFAELEPLNALANTLNCTLGHITPDYSPDLCSRHQALAHRPHDLLHLSLVLGCQSVSLLACCCLLGTQCVSHDVVHPPDVASDAADDPHRFSRAANVSPLFASQICSVSHGKLQ